MVYRCHYIYIPQTLSLYSYFLWLKIFLKFITNFIFLTGANFIITLLNILFYFFTSIKIQVFSYFQDFFKILFDCVCFVYLCYIPSRGIRVLKTPFYNNSENKIKKKSPLYRSRTREFSSSHTALYTRWLIYTNSCI